MLTNQVHAWVDATDYEGLEEVRSTPIINNDVDQQMICDIQRAVSRLRNRESLSINWYENFVLRFYNFFYIRQFHHQSSTEAIKQTDNDHKRKTTATAKQQRKKARYRTAAVDNSWSSRMAYSR